MVQSVIGYSEYVSYMCEKSVSDTYSRTVVGIANTSLYNPTLKHSQQSESPFKVIGIGISEFRPVCANFLSFFVDQSYR